MSAPLMCTDFQPCSCCVYYIFCRLCECKGGEGTYSVYQHVAGMSQHVVIKSRCGMSSLILPYLSPHMAKRNWT